MPWVHESEGDALLKLNGDQRATKTFFATVCGLAIGAATLPAWTNHADILHGDFNGSTVSYLGVTEAATTDDPDLLYGAPTITGDTLVFSPTGDFASEAPDNGDAGDSTDGKLSFTLSASSGLLDSLIITEFGEYSVFAVGSDEAGAFISGEVLISSGGNLLLTAPIVISPVPPFLGGSGTGVWIGLAEIDLSGLGVSEVDIVINNTLQTVANGAATANVTKSGFSINAVVPEPSVIVLMLAGGGLIAARRRR